MAYIKCFTLEEKKYSRIIFTTFVFGYLFAAMFIFLSRFLDCPLCNASAIVTRYCPILDVAGALNPLQYASTWIAYTNNLLQVPDERNIQLVIVSSVYHHYIWFLRFDINQ